MEPAYETEAERIRNHVKQMPFRKRLANWWDYHKFHVALAGIALLLAAYFAFQDRSMGPEADYSVRWVGTSQLSEASAAQIEDALATYGTDLNSDGIVRVKLYQCVLDLDAVMKRGVQGEQERANLMALEADMSCGQSTVFLLEDPEAFQSYCGGLVRPDSSPPEDGDNWKDLVITWDLPTGSYYLGLRGCWMESQQAAWEQGYTLWENMIRSLKKG